MKQIHQVKTKFPRIDNTAANTVSTSNKTNSFAHPNIHHKSRKSATNSSFISQKQIHPPLYPRKQFKLHAYLRSKYYKRLRNHKEELETSPLNTWSQRRGNHGRLVLLVILGQKTEHHQQNKYRYFAKTVK
jgi:hypothetical protein